ncbi:MAG TPA: hypothetical protein VFS23_17395, partial [Vicinamibacterales bacterium]|nr:hypothetical protein [Vicinamibacterales bacterium]
ASLRNSRSGESPTEQKFTAASLEYQFGHRARQNSRCSGRALFAHGMVRPDSNAKKRETETVPCDLANFQELISVKEHKFGARAQWYKGCTTHGAGVTVNPARSSYVVR